MYMSLAVTHGQVPDNERPPPLRFPPLGEILEPLSTKQLHFYSYKNQLLIALGHLPLVCPRIRQLEPCGGAHTCGPTPESARSIGMIS